jgi:hypothetical protein
MMTPMRMPTGPMRRMPMRTRRPTRR